MYHLSFILYLTVEITGNLAPLIDIKSFVQIMYVLFMLNNII